MSDNHDLKITMLALEYMKWVYPKGVNSTNDGSASGFLQLFSQCKREIFELYPDLVWDADLTE